MYFATLKEVTWGCCVEINGSDIFGVILLPIIRKIEHYPFSNNYYYYKSRHIIRDMVAMLTFKILSILVTHNTQDVIILSDNSNVNYTKCGYKWILNNKGDATITHNANLQS